MSWPQNAQLAFDEALGKAHEYPLNLVKTNNFEFTLEAYRQRLSTDQITIFDPRPWGKEAMVFLDYQGASQRKILAAK
jgi:hypothetical protein